MSMKAPGLALIAAAAACATAPPPSPPVTSLAGKACGPAVSVADAVSAAPEKPKAHHAVTATLDASSPCATEGEGAAPFNYVVFALPTDTPAHLATVGARREALRVVPPRVSILDEAGTARSVMTSEEARNVGSVLGFQIALRPQDRYVVIASDPAGVGAARSRVETGIARGTGGMMVGTTYASYSTMHGVDAATNRTGSHEGTVVLTLDWPRED